MDGKAVKISIWFDYDTMEQFTKSVIWEKFIGPAIETNRALVWEHEEQAEVW